MPESTLRCIKQDEEDVLLRLLSETHGSFHDPSEVKRVLASASFNHNGCFLAEENGSVVGCVAVTSLPREGWFVVRYLAVQNTTSKIKTAQILVSKAIGYAESNRAEFLRATTPAIQPYVDIYKDSGFKPLRRDFRISWNLEEALEPEARTIDTREISSDSSEGSKVFVESLHPYWDWRTEEQGGSEAVARNFKDGTKRGERWLLALIKSRPVGLFGLIPNYRETGEARFRGAFVLPEDRGKGIGLALMRKGISWAKKLGQRKMLVYTFSHLDSLAPGALLYLKSGGKIDSEYLQLRRK